MTSSAESRPRVPTIKGSEPDDPMELRGEEVPGDLTIMVRCIVEELLLLGHHPARIRAMAASEELQALFVARSRLGAERMDALVTDAARRIGVAAKAREVRGVDRVVVRDGDAIGALLTRLGAHDSVLAWEERRMRREVRATANRLANFDDANLRRSARAAVAAGARVARALEILGDEIPDHLRPAGDLRLEHKQASLEELGQLHDPVLTKDAIAGRIRRLLAMADRRAEDLGVPDTEASLTPEMLEEG